MTKIHSIALVASLLLAQIALFAQTFNNVDANIVIASGTNVVITGGFTNAATLSNSGTVILTGDWANNGTAAIGAGEVEFNGTSLQTVSGSAVTAFGNLKVNNAANVSLSQDALVNSTLTFSNGKVNTAANKISLASSGTVSGASATRYVNGNFEKFIAASTASKDFEIGDATNYSPLNLAFTGVTNGAGSITASTTVLDHPNILTSGLDATKSVNRFWSLLNTGVTGFTTYNATFNFNNPSDLDVGAIPANFLIKRYNGSWFSTTTGTLTSSSSQAIGLVGFDDFQIAQIVSGYTWTGDTSTAWTEPTNWSPNGLPNDCANDVTIPNGLTNYPLIGLATFTVGDLTIQEGATLTINGGGTGSLKVCGDVTAGTTTNATITGNSTNGLILEGSANQQILGKLNIDRLRLNNSAGATLQTGANVSINKAAELQLGTLAINGQTMTFNSTSATNYAILDNFSSGFTGTLTGNATAERYVPVTGINQHYIGSPVTSTTFAQLGASGTPGFVIPKPNCDQLNVASNSPYGNIFQWHDNIPANATCLYNGWEVKTAGTAQAGKGYSVYLPNGTFAITGPLNQGNNYSVSGLDNIGWESNTLQTVSTIPAVYKSGWHIVANPFLAPLELSGHSADFSSAAVWVTSGPFAGTYQSVAITGGEIAPFQGFIVRRSAPSAATFTFDKSECTTTTGVQFYKTASEHALSLQVSGNGFNDITRVEFNSATTNTFDVDYDAFKPMSALGQPTIASFNTDPTERLAINVNKDIAETPNVQLNFVPGNNGTFSFTADGINTFDPTSYITLEDSKEGTMTDLRQNPIYTFTANKTDNHSRFVLHFTPAAVLATTNATCTANGKLDITQEGPADWNVVITNSQNANINTGNGTLNTANPISLTVPKDVYTVTLTDNSGYQVVKNVQVNGQTPQATASMTTSNTTIEEEQAITVTNTTTNNNPTTQTWDFGDGTSATTATADHTYTNPGVYTITLTVTNQDGCEATTTQTITVTEKVNTNIATATKETITIYPNPASTKLNINISQVTAETKLTLTNALGQTVQTQDKLKAGVNTIEVSQVAEGIYLITVNEGKTVLTTQRIVITK